MASELLFAKVVSSELAALRGNAKPADDLAWICGPNHRQIAMFHYVLTGSATDQPGTIANLFSGDCGDDILEINSSSSQPLGDADARAFSDMMSKLESAENANAVEAVAQLTKQLDQFTKGLVAESASEFGTNGATDARPLSALAPDCLPNLSKLLATVDPDTARARWRTYCAENNLDHVDEDADVFHEVLAELKSLCDEAMAEQSTIVFTWG